MKNDSRFSQSQIAQHQRYMNGQANVSGARGAAGGAGIGIAVIGGVNFLERYIKSAYKQIRIEFNNWDRK